ncbi:zinc finger matrin-type protein 5 [Sabethes cyaneus]|uniref:zinc finger matrin-type protein 5 n=1 Tax=Sabethes cyaneus TaxID=53552 RepID=UPI00237DAA1D|nr:zinc finger matrin-type protein 5 [Sabethes cyaneus]
MGKKFYCDFCEKHIQRDPGIIRKHNEGIAHIRNKAAYYESLKDPQQILAEVKTKKPCRTLQSSQVCTFGAICRFNHYQPDELKQLHEKAQAIHGQELKRKSDIITRLAAADSAVEKFVANRQKRRAMSVGIEYEPFWLQSEPERMETSFPPSLRAIETTLIKCNPFTSWG